MDTVPDFEVFGVSREARDLLSAVWREACRHIEIEQSAAAIAEAMSAVMPLRGLLLLRSDEASHTLETLAVGAVHDGFRAAARTAELPADAWRGLLRWLKSGEPLHYSAADGHDWIRRALPAGIVGEVLVGPLRSGGKASGMLVVEAGRDASFTAGHRTVFTQLLEPFAIALENDGRFHELKSLREAAEADRQRLLTRLGRQDFNEDVVGARTGLRHVMERVELVAGSDVPVLILGETGTGKEVVSRAIHTRSKRADGPFIRVNCGAIPPELVDSQLFGHERGSFTGAADQHQGWFERADRGTLFLDEIGELPLPAQVRLLRVLQDHQIERVGGKSPLHVDVRIVAATHRDLSTMVKEKAFREDLWYRINIFPILLPTLRERLEDIPALVRHFAQRAATRFGLPAVDPTEADLHLLAAYDWPGNIRELGAVIDRAAILGGGRSLDVETALGLGRRPAPVPRPPHSGDTRDDAGPRPPAAVETEGPPTPGGVVPLATAMRQHIERALVVTHGRIEGPRGAARLLQINPHTLRARMRKLGVEADRFRR